MEILEPYDVILLTNRLNCSDYAVNLRLLPRMHAARKPGCSVVMIEFVPALTASRPRARRVFAADAGLHAGERRAQPLKLKR